MLYPTTHRISVKPESKKHRLKRHDEPESSAAVVGWNATRAQAQARTLNNNTNFKLLMPRNDFVAGARLDLASVGPFGEKRCFPESINLRSCLMCFCGFL